MPSTVIKRLNLQRIVIFSAIAIGCGLRLLWAEDMEWKADEIWMFEQARSILLGTTPWPAVGMLNSAGFVNPGMSLWAFVPMAGSPDPIVMVRWVMALNIGAIGAFIAFILWRIPKAQQLTWLWGMAIASVNPMAILFSRKIWAQNILPPFCFLIFLGHQFRSRTWGAFLWGLVGAIVGQVHMSGFFFQPVLVVWTLWAERMEMGKTRWLSFTIGSAIGIIPLLPWVNYLVTHLVTHGLKSGAGRNFVPEFYLQWLTTGWGLNLEHQLDQVFWQVFLAEPRIAGVPTYGMAIAHLVLAVAALTTLGAWVKSTGYRQQVRSVLGYELLRFYLASGAIGMGLFLTGIGQRVPVYYLTMLFPWPYLWVVVMSRSKPNWLSAIVALQLAISITFLGFIHQQGGIADGKYGRAYHLQSYQMQQNQR
jgi:hypothetical protein